MNCNKVIHRNYILYGMSYFIVLNLHFDVKDKFGCKRTNIIVKRESCSVTKLNFSDIIK